MSQETSKFTVLGCIGCPFAIKQGWMGETLSCNLTKKVVYGPLMDVPIPPPKDCPLRTASKLIELTIV